MAATQLDAPSNSMVDLSIELGTNAKSPLLLRNPVLVASGTFGYGTEYGRLVDIQRLGAIVSKGITVRPRRSSRHPLEC
jgi:dihydroorotate dehydrogenase (NAD+) catalytic subunit